MIKIRSIIPILNKETCRFKQTILLFVLLISLSNTGNALEIPLTIDEPRGVARIGEPVTFGIPLPAGTPIQNWSLWEGATEIPVQVTPLPGKTPWILLDFQVNIPASSKKVYNIKNMPQTVAPANPISMSEDGNKIVVLTGPMKIIINKTYFNVIDGLWIDQNNDGAFSDIEQIVNSPLENIKIVDSESGTTYYGNVTPEKILWEYKGSIRATLRIDGKYTINSTDYIKYTTRLTFYAGKAFMKIDWVLKNSFQYNERHVKLKSASIKIGAGTKKISVSKPGSVSWASMDTNGFEFELVPTTLWNIDTATNNGMVIPDLSYHGATLIADYSYGLSADEQARRANASTSPLFGLAPAKWYSEYGELSTTRFATLEDEKNTYSKWEWTWTASQEPTDLPKPSYSVSWKDIDVHNESESDDLWQNIIMYIRTGQRGYFDRFNAWARYYKWEYVYRTDDFSFAWDSNYESPRVTRPYTPITLTSADTDYLTNDVALGKIDIRSWGADHLWGWGLLDYYYLTGDADALDAAVDIGEISERVFGWRKAGYEMAKASMRRGARHLILSTRLWEATQDSRWLTLANKIADLWMNSPDWDKRGFYYFDDSYVASKFPKEYIGKARVNSPVHVGFLAHGFERYYNATGNTDVRNRLVAMARWASQYGVDIKFNYTGSAISLDYPKYGQLVHNYFITEPVTFYDPSYTVCLVDLLTIGYRITGDNFLIYRAKNLWNRASKGVYGDISRRYVGDNQVGRFVNNKFTSGNNYYDYNKGDLSYAHRMFYDFSNLTISKPPPMFPSQIKIQ